MALTLEIASSLSLFMEKHIKNHIKKMSTSSQVALLENEAESDFDGLLERITNIRESLVENDQNLIGNISSSEGRTFAIHIWNVAVKLQNRIPNLKPDESSVLKLTIIPQLRILSVDILKKFGRKNNDDDISLLFYFYCYTYKSLVDSNNFPLAEKYSQSALELFPNLEPSSNTTQNLVQLKVWQSQTELTNGIGNGLNILKELVEKYSVESSILVSYAYEKSIELQSIEWCQFCLQLVKNSKSLSNEWENQILTLLSQLFLNKGKAGEAMKIIEMIPESLNKLYLELKCTIILHPNNPDLKHKLISFIPKTEKDRRILAALCIFIADNYRNNINNCGKSIKDKYDKTMMGFMKEVIKLICIENTNKDTHKYIWISAFRIICEQNNLEEAMTLLENNYLRQQISDEDRRKIVGLLWNQALDEYDLKNYISAAKWMTLAQKQISEIDNQANSCCYRFLCRCMNEEKQYGEALNYIDKAIYLQPNCSHGYLLKFRILIQIGNETEANNFLSEVMTNSPFLEEFEPAFFTSIAAELHIIGNNKLALRILLKFIELDCHLYQNFSDFSSLRINAVNSIFAILQHVDDINIIYQAIESIAYKWKEVNFETINSYVTIAFNCGIEFKKQEKWQKAANSFEYGALFSNDNLDCKAPCIFESIDCLLNLPLDSFDQGMQSSKKIIQKSTQMLDELAPFIGNAPQKIKEGFILSKIKVLISANDDNINSIISLIDEISSPFNLSNLCDYICTKKTDSKILQALLYRAQLIDASKNVLASILHQIIIRSNNRNDLKKCYELISKFIYENSKEMSHDQIQFFMARAWNIGVQHIKSLRITDGEWWLKTALSLMNCNEQLQKIYSDDLNAKYSNFIGNCNSFNFL